MYFGAKLSRRSRRFADLARQVSVVVLGARTTAISSNRFIDVLTSASSIPVPFTFTRIFAL